MIPIQTLSQINRMIQKAENEAFWKEALKQLKEFIEAEFFINNKQLLN